MFYLYVLKSKKDKNLYIGYSADLKKRLAMHDTGAVESTKNRRPLELIYYEAYKNKDDAMGREKQLKHFGKSYSNLKRKIAKSIDA